MMQQNPVEFYNLGKLGIIGMKGAKTSLRKQICTLKSLMRTACLILKVFLFLQIFPDLERARRKQLYRIRFRTYDIYIIVDPFNYGVTYNMYGAEHPMSPDDHYQDLKRVISALGGKPKRITVIMPMMYEGRQHRRIARESLDCAMMLQDLSNMGVDNFLTFDAHVREYRRLYR